MCKGEACLSLIFVIWNLSANRMEKAMKIRRF